MCVQAMDLFDMSDGFSSLEEGASKVTSPVLVRHTHTHAHAPVSPMYIQILGVTSDVLFPVQQQREMSKLLQKSGRIHYPAAY